MDTTCTIHKTTEVIGKKWSVLILHELHKSGGAIRFNDLKRKLPNITPKMLSLRLNELNGHGLLSNAVKAKEIPVSVEYRLTRSGTDFINIIKDIKSWALKWNIKNKLCKNTDCENCGL